jgi:hypothetical protein
MSVEVRSREVDFRKVLVVTGKTSLVLAGIFSIGMYISARSHADFLMQQATATNILDGGGEGGVSLLDSATYRVVVNRPWIDGTSGTSFGGVDKAIIGDHALGNALKTVRGISGCEINSVDRLDAPIGDYPQFGTFAVTTRC